MSERDLTITEWCRKRGFSRSYYYDVLRKRGLAPKEIRPSPQTIRITAAADREWEEARMREAEARRQRRAAKAAAAHRP